MKQTKTQQRVAIMRDVIKQLDANRLIAQSGTYLRMHLSPWQDRPAISRDNLKQGVVPQCSVCALGAMFIGAVDRFNQFDGQLGTLTMDDDMRDHLSSYFSKKQIMQIEELFEGWFDTNEDFARMQEFKSLSADTRLRFICKHIIKNKGRFSMKQAMNAAQKFASKQS